MSTEAAKYKFGFNHGTDNCLQSKTIDSAILEVENYVKKHYSTKGYEGLCLFIYETGKDLPVAIKYELNLEFKIMTIETEIETKFYNEFPVKDEPIIGYDTEKEAREQALIHKQRFYNEKQVNTYNRSNNVSILRVKLLNGCAI